MFGLLGQLSDLNFEEITKQALEFKEVVETRVKSIEETQARIEQKLDEVLATTRIKED